MPELRSVTFQRIGAAAGIATPLIAFTCILTAVASYRDFSWTNNALSDLGVIPGITGLLFNIGLIISGFLSIIFAVLGLRFFFLANFVGKIGSIFFSAANLALMAIGIFNENFSPTHYLVSVAFFMLAPISLFILTGAFWRCHQRSMALFTVLVGVIAALPWLLLFALNYVPNVAVPEFLSGLAISAWAVVLSKKMLNSKI